MRCALCIRFQGLKACARTEWGSRNVWHSDRSPCGGTFGMCVANENNGVVTGIPAIPGSARARKKRGGRK